MTITTNCPFCGQNPQLFSYEDCSWVSCQNDKCCLFDIELNPQKWNQRVTQPSAEPQRSEREKCQLSAMDADVLPPKEQVQGVGVDEGPYIPDDIAEWVGHLNLHLTEHDLPHAGKALRAAWPAVRSYYNDRIGVLVNALNLLYQETADYIMRNNLGDVHHNQSMRLAYEALSTTKIFQPTASPVGDGELYEAAKVIIWYARRAAQKMDYEDVMAPHAEVEWLRNLQPEMTRFLELSGFGFGLDSKADDALVILRPPAPVAGKTHIPGPKNPPRQPNDKERG